MLIAFRNHVNIHPMKKQSGKKPGTTQLSVSMQSDTVKELRAVAKRERMSVSSIINELVETSLLEKTCESPDASYHWQQAILGYHPKCQDCGRNAWMMGWNFKEEDHEKRIEGDYSYGEPRLICSQCCMMRRYTFTVGFKEFLGKPLRAIRTLGDFTADKTLFRVFKLLQEDLEKQ